MLALLIAGASGMSFNEYLLQFNKQYPAAELQAREKLFATRLAEIEAHNSNPNNSYKLGINQFTDAHEHEFKRMLGHRPIGRKLFNADKTVIPQGYQLPTAIDWRDQNILTPVKDQGHCGSCWAFATVATVESTLAIATGKSLVLSTQNVVSCTENPNHCGGQGGCDGATAELGFDYVMNHGIALEQEYPYKAETGVCQKGAKKSAATAGFTQLASNNQDILLYSVVNSGPIAISVDASRWGAYSGGIFDGCGKNATINHAVQLVGYGEENGVKYWIVRNSWGPKWGEKGFIRLKRFNTATEFCGIDNDPASGTACDHGPTNVTVCGMCGMLFDSAYPIGAVLL